MIEFSFLFISMFIISNLSTTALSFNNIVTFVILSEVFGLCIVPTTVPVILLNSCPQGAVITTTTFMVSAVELLIPALFLKTFYSY